MNHFTPKQYFLQNLLIIKFQKRNTTLKLCHRRLEKNVEWDRVNRGVLGWS